MTEDQKELEQKMYAAWLDTIYWVAGETKYRLLEAAGSVQKIYEMEEGQVAASASCSTGSAMNHSRYGTISQSSASAIRTVRQPISQGSSRRSQIRLLASSTEGGCPTKGRLRWQ